MARTRIAEFGIIQKALAGASVAVYFADTNGESTGVLAPIYQAGVGLGQRANPQVLDADGKLPDDCWVETQVMAEISNITETAERSLKKIRANPLQYPLPVTSSSVYAADSALAQQAAVTATAQAGIATTQAGIATTGAGTATTQAGISTTQAGISTTQASNAAASAAQAIAAQTGMKRKIPVRAGTTGALPSSNYSNGASGVGATITATANGAWSSANSDGVSLILNDGLVVKNEGSQLRNGLYLLTQVGTAGTPWILTRQTDSDTWAEIAAAVVTIMEGSTQADLDYLCTSNLSGGVMGTTAITWQAYNSVIADGAVSTTAKIANAIITFAKMATSSIASLGDWAAGTADKLLTAANFLPALAAALGHSARYSSEAQALALGTAVVVNHGLGGTPDFAAVKFTCTSTDGDYAFGDVLFQNYADRDRTANPGAQNNIGIVLKATATQLILYVGNSFFMNVLSSTGVYTTLDPAKWTATLIAWK